MNESQQTNFRAVNDAMYFVNIFVILIQEWKYHKGSDRIKIVATNSTTHFQHMGLKVAEDQGILLEVQYQY